jgi:hypothetical protein
MLKTHAEDEMRILFPHLNNNPSLHFIMGRSHLQLSILEHNIPGKLASMSATTAHELDKLVRLIEKSETKDPELLTVKRSLTCVSKTEAISTEGFSVKIYKGNSAHYQENGKILVCKYLYQKNLCVVVPTNISRWMPPHSDEPIPYDLKVIISFRISETINFIMRENATS